MDSRNSESDSIELDSWDANPSDVESLGAESLDAGSFDSNETPSEPLRWDDPRQGLPLLVATDPSWSDVALAQLGQVLCDHAYCEHKAASSGLRMIGQFPDYPQLIRPMIALAQEEILHFKQVYQLIEARGLRLRGPRPDRYVKALRQRFSSEGQGIGGLGDSLLVNAFVEARSCERFRLLAEALHQQPAADDDGRTLVRFYSRLAAAEGRHWETFRDLALELLPGVAVEQRLHEVAEMEADVIRSLPIEPRMH